jgi:hypothetical protein
MKRATRLRGETIKVHRALPLSRLTHKSSMEDKLHKYGDDQESHFGLGSRADVVVSRS